MREIGYEPERDVENTADSVFCSHGAGFVVNWRDAMDYMHVQTAFLDVRPQVKETDAPVRRSTGYQGTPEEDQELMAIFERTYGPVKNRTFFEPVRKNIPAAPVQMEASGTEYLLVEQDDCYEMSPFDCLKRSCEYLHALGLK